MPKIKTVIIFSIIFFGALFFAKISWAVESICPGGSNPDPNVIFCDDFEIGDFSRWGHGPAFDTNPPTRLMVSSARPFLGQYSAQFVYGELGSPSYEYLDFSGVEEVRVRFYILMDDLYHWGVGYADHMFAVEGQGGTACSGAGSVDWGPWGPNLYRPAICNGARVNDLPPNMGLSEDRIIHNGKWYRIEFHFKLNTIGGCSDKNGNGVIDPEGECDGVYELWLDGKQISGYYTLNNRGDNSNWKISGFLFNHYFRTGGQTFNGRPFYEYRDNLVVMSGNNGGNQIGPVINGPSFMGNPDLLSPYQTQLYKEWFAFDANNNSIRPGADCAFGFGYVGGWFYNSAPSFFVSSPVHNGVQSPCASFVPAGNDKAMAAKTIQEHDFSGVGTDGAPVLPAMGHVINGWMYLDPASFPASKGAALSGMIFYANSNSRNYIAMGVDNQNHPVLIKQFNNPNGTPIILASNSSVTISPGSWHHFEVRGSESHTWSVWLDGLEVLNVSGVDDSTLWNIWSAGGYWGYHFGIIDHLLNPSPLTVYYDDISIGSTSFEDCFGWNTTLCPFQNGTPPDTTPPAAPTGVTVI